MYNDFLTSTTRQLANYKLLAEKTFSQIPDEVLFWQYNEESNSIATIVKHLSGNMLSRWTDFLETDGEKEWRNRDAEFLNNISTRAEMMDLWNKGWQCLFLALSRLTPADLQKEIHIRNQTHSVLEAISRQLAHYPYHVGQIVYIGKMASNNNWSSLSIPRGDSEKFNAGKFSQPKHPEHFTDDVLKRKES